MRDDSPDEFRHGATDSGPEPVADFSTNVHPLGPCPSVAANLSRAARDRYPDPDYLELRRRLGEFHQVDPDRIVPGSGASELIHRLVGIRPGPVLTLRRTFVEYRRAASQWDRQIFLADDPAQFVELLDRASIAFLCHPNNPDGTELASGVLAEAAHRARACGTILVLDLAYWSITTSANQPLPESATWMFAPNKPLDCAGVRAAYLVAPHTDLANQWRRRSPSWVVGSEGVALLESWCSPEVRNWLSRKAPQVRRLLRCLEAILRRSGWTVQPTKANFLLAQPAHPNAIERIRRAGLRIRDASNMGSPGWFRLAARPVRQLRLLRDALGPQV